MTKSSTLALLATLGFATVAHAATPTVTALEALTAVQQQSGNDAVENDLHNQGRHLAYHVQAVNKGSKLDFLVDGATGKVSPMSGAQAAVTGDATEAGEGPNDADSGNEDAN